MRTFINILFCFALMTAMKTGVPAHETFTPLISENCIAFVHVDCSKIELDNVKTALQKTGEHVLKELGFDEKSFTATARELSIELEKLDMLVRPTWEILTKEIGITEVAWIFDMQLFENVGSSIAIPWKDKTDEQLQLLRTLFRQVNEPIAFVEFIPIGDLLLLAHPYDLEEVTDWAKTIKPAPATSPIHEALKSVADADIKIAVALPEQLRERIRDHVNRSPEMPASLRNDILFMTLQVQWASASLSLQSFFNSESSESSNVLLTIKTARPSDAMMLHGTLENWIELGVNTARRTMEQRIAVDEVVLTAAELWFMSSSLPFSFAKGLLRTLLPEVEGDKLLFRVKGNLGESVQMYTAIGTGVAWLLPAVRVVERTPQLYGKVMFSDGTPVPTGVIHFETPTFLARGDIRPDGTYTIDGGIPSGTYTVSIRGTEEVDPQYHHSTTSSLQCDIQGSGKHVFDIMVNRRVER